MAKKEKAPPAPRRGAPKHARARLGRILVPSMLIVLAAVYFRQELLLLPAFLLWVVMALILYKYWRCPQCGKTLPKTGKTFECPKCGAKID
mgnify:FL=1